MRIRKQWGRCNMERIQRKLSTSQWIILGFASVILLGSILLMLPLATRDGEGACFTDAIFTATSAVCVTGLIVQDTATYWSGFGQVVILTLIQIGGMGVVTLAVAMAMASGAPWGADSRLTPFRQYTTSSPIMAGGSTCPR